MTSGMKMAYAVRAFDGGPVMCVGGLGFCADALGVSIGSLKASKSFSVEKFNRREYAASRGGAVVKAGTARELAGKLRCSESCVRSGCRTGEPALGWRMKMTENGASWAHPEAKRLADEAIDRRCRQSGCGNVRKGGRR